MILEFNSKRKEPSPFYQDKIAAAELTAQAFEMIKKAAHQRNVPVDRINDPNETGLIGLQFSPITTRRGDLDAKLTSTNPNIAALVIQLLRNARIEKGETVAVSLSGSMPALNIAVLCALQVLEMKPVVITSLSASMWGANYPEFTYLDMEAVLVDAGLFYFKTTAASFGGENDAGRGMSPEGRELSVAAMERNGVEHLIIRNVEDAIQSRLRRFQEHGAVRLLINVDEQPTIFTGLDVPPGYLPAHSIREGSGLIAALSNQGIKVINIVDLNFLAQKHGLPIAPIPIPGIGTGSLYYQFRYSTIQAIISFLFLTIILVVVIRYDIESYLIRRKK